MNSEANGYVYKPGDIIIMTEQKIFNYRFDTEWDSGRIFRIYTISHKCDNCGKCITSQITSSVQYDVEFSGIYSHLKTCQNAVCIESTENDTNKKQTTIKYKKAVTLPVHST